MLLICVFQVPCCIWWWLGNSRIVIYRNSNFSQPVHSQTLDLFSMRMCHIHHGEHQFGNKCLKHQNPLNDHDSFANYVLVIFDWNWMGMWYYFYAFNFCICYPAPRQNSAEIVPGGTRRQPSEYSPLNNARSTTRFLIIIIWMGHFLQYITAYIIGSDYSTAVDQS